MTYLLSSWTLNLNSVIQSLNQGHINAMPVWVCMSVELGFLVLRAYRH